MGASEHPLPPAIVVGHAQTGLGTLRSLRMAGIPAYVACPQGDLVTRSRWFRPTPGVPTWDGRPGAQAEEALRAMPLPGAVLIPGADDAALWLAGIPESELGRRFKVSSSSRETLQILQDKARFASFLARTDIPHPQTFVLASEADIDAIPLERLGKVFLKPADSQRFNSRIGAKGIWAASRDEIRVVWLRMHEIGLATLAQEYVPGSAADHYFLDGFRDCHGQLTGLFARRRVRIFPPDFGNSSYCESIPLTELPTAIRSLRTLLSMLKYRGIFSAEFKRDARDGEFRILEVNTRAWWYVEFAARCGVNVCRMAYEDANELPVTPTTKYRSGAGCVNFYGDINTVLAGNRTTRGPLARILSQWARTHFLVFRLDDPWPGLSVALELAGQATRNNIRHALGK